MSARKTTITVLAALLAWTAAPSATAQSMEPAAGWVPGQPYVVTISDAVLEPLMVVHVGRVPILSTGERVRLFLPNLDRTGLVYAVSTFGDDAGRQPPGSGPRKARKPQYVVGRVHTVVIPSPANPALGQAPDVLLVIDARGVTAHMTGTGGGQDDQADLTLGTMVTGSGVLGTQPWMPRRSLDGGRPRGHIVPPQPDPHGAERRMIRPPEASPMRRFADGMGTFGKVRDALDGAGDRATTFDSGGAGIPEAAAAASADEPCYKGPWVTAGCGSMTSKDDVLAVQPASTRRTLDGGRPAGERVGPRERKGVPRPLDDDPFVRTRGFPGTGDGVLGTGLFPWHLGDQGHTLDGAMR